MDSKTVVGDDLAHENLQSAVEAAQEVGAKDAVMAVKEGSPVEANSWASTHESVDLLIVGNRGSDRLPDDCSARCRRTSPASLTAT